MLFDKYWTPVSTRPARPWTLLLLLVQSSDPSFFASIIKQAIRTLLDKQVFDSGLHPSGPSFFAFVQSWDPIQVYLLSDSGVDALLQTYALLLLIIALSRILLAVCFYNRALLSVAPLNGHDKWIKWWVRFQLTFFCLFLQFRVCFWPRRFQRKGLRLENDFEISRLFPPLLHRGRGHVCELITILSILVYKTFFYLSHTIQWVLFLNTCSNL